MEPLTIGIIVAGLLAVYHFGKSIGRKAEKDAAELAQQIDKEQDPDGKQDLTLLWARAKGMPGHTRRAFEAAITETDSGVDCFTRGVNARGAGRPLSKNPFGTRLWGKGKEWHDGWIWANQNPDQSQPNKQELRE